MPASEKTWYDMKTLHVAFGATGVLLLLATVWTIGADHTREWKQYQRQMRKMDTRLTQWRMEAEQTQQTAQTRQQLQSELDEALAAAPEPSVFDRFVALVDERQQDDLRRQYRELSETEASAEQKRAERRALVDAMDRIVQRAKFQEDNRLSERKFQSANLDESRATFDLAVPDERGEQLEALQAEIDLQRKNRDELTVAYQQAATYRQQLQELLRQMIAPVDQLQQQLQDNQAEYDQLASSLEERSATYFTSRPPFLGKKWLETPVLDAFNSPLKIQNLWTENLTMPNGSFGTVRRFDRCTTCHEAIDRSAPGSAVEPLYQPVQEIVLRLQTPESAPEPERDPGSGTDEPAPPSDITLASVYGLELANEGLLDPNQVTVRRVLPDSPAAVAPHEDGTTGEFPGFVVGDVLLYVNQDKVLSVDDARRFLLRDVNWGQSLTVRVRRGQPHPFSSHPRLDLFVGALSPHKVSVFGCTVCHEGQGSATAFQWASHSPNDPQQQQRWIREHGWSHNHHWIYPMYPRRFAESTCLKCHHDVVELEVSESYSEPPAPKLVQGYDLVREHGCFGCHEINGYKGPNERVGPDMRLEPNYFAAAAQIQADPDFASLAEELRDWVQQLVQHPERDKVRHQILEFLQQDAAAEQPQLTATSHDMTTVLADIEIPGTLRKTGPSLRHVATKVGPTWLYDWIRDPAHFRPSTRMPRFFGHWDHLDPEERAVAERYEPVEILGLVTYLTKRSQPLELMERDSDVSPGDEQAVERGKRLFETRGCLACHAHQDFPAGQATQGPDLSNVADKFSLPDTPDARRWLFTWLKSPTRYHPRTKMPDLYLDVMQQGDGSASDAAADIAMYLLSSTTGWQPVEGTTQALTPNPEALNGLVLEHLKTKLYLQDAEDALKQGRISERLTTTLEGAETLLAGELDDQKKLLYVGHKTITKYGCFACHDIPGFENAKPIGTGLADWGRKDPSRLAFEHIAEYVQHGHGNHASSAGHETHGQAGPEQLTAVADDGFDESFYHERLLEHDRAGFIWQKLKEPRSYDYRKARNKDSYNDRTRMPLFGLDPQQREAVITFVLGLVAEPPAYEFVYHPDERTQALIAGRRALEKFNCVGCHIVEPEKLTIEFPSGEFGSQASSPESTYPFTTTHFATDKIEASRVVNPMRGTVRATLHGMPTLTRDGTPMILDEEGDPIEADWEYDPATLIHLFDLWQPTLIEGEPYEAGLSPVEMPASMITHRQPTYGGDLTHWLLPRAVELEQEVNPQADGKQAYGWLAPPLIDQGRKVQSEWLYQFLLQPFTIRPATLLRMPRFNLSSEEATDLVNYFAAKDRADYPYEYSERTQESRLTRAEQHYQARLQEVPLTERPPGQTRFDHALNIIASSDYCVKCHLVGDFDPEGDDRAKAPDLSVVGQRLRPEYMRHWIANPVQIVPYTPMPVNIQYSADDPEHLGGVDQGLYRGTSIEQLDALVDLLMNYPRFTESRAGVSELIQSAASTDALELEIDESAEESEPAADEASPADVDSEAEAS